MSKLPPGSQAWRIKLSKRKKAPVRGAFFAKEVERPRSGSGLHAQARSIKGAFAHSKVTPRGPEA